VTARQTHFRACNLCELDGMFDTLNTSN